MKESKKRDRREYLKKYRKENAHKYVEYQNEYRKRLRIETLKHYSKGEPKCACCGENEVKFLCFDHIKGGGTIHRKETRHGSIAWWLKKNNYPYGFQVLCHNCNMAKGAYGTCPHKLGSHSAS